MIDSAPSDDDLLIDLLVEWEERVARGEVVSPADLCRDRPDLVPEFTERIARLKRVGRLADLGNPSSSTSGLLPTDQPLAGRYRLEKLIGVGSFSTVWRAHDLLLERSVAVKVLRSDRSPRSPGVEDAVLAGAGRVVGLALPGIAAVYDTVLHGGTPFIVSELIDGIDLARLLRHGPFPMREAVRIVAEVAANIHQAHEQGFVHGNIKPSNVLLDAGSRVILTDVGMAIRKADGGKALACMAPEQLAPEPGGVDRRADVFALGVVLFELLTGRGPFGRDTASAAGPTEPPSARQQNNAIPVRLDQICKRCLEYRPANRYESAQSLADDLQEWLRIRSPAQRLPDRRIVVLTIIISAFLIGLFLSSRPGQLPPTNSSTPKLESHANGAPTVLKGSLTRTSVQDLSGGFPPTYFSTRTFEYNGGGAPAVPTERGSRALAQDSSWLGRKVMLRTTPAVIDTVDNMAQKVSVSRIWRVSRVLEDKEGNLKIRYAGAECLVRKDEAVLIEDAPAYFTDLIRVKDGYAWPLLLRGGAWAWIGECNKAVTDCTEGIRLAPWNAQAYLIRAIAWSQMKEYHKATEDLDEAIRLEPENADAFALRGHAWYQMNERGKAIRDADEAIRLDPKNAEAFFCRGLFFYDRKDLDKAIDDLDAVILLDPGNTDALVCRGSAWNCKKEFDKAIRDLDAAIRLDPENANVSVWRSRAWSFKKEYDVAIKGLDEAIRFDPPWVRSLVICGDAFLWAKQYDKAIKNFDVAIRLEPQNDVAFFRRGLARCQKKEYARAIKDFDEAIRLHPDYAYAVIWCYFAARRTADERVAERVLKDAANIRSGSWPYPVVQFLNGQINEAESLMPAYTNYRRTEAHFYLGLDQSIKGGKEEAMAHFRWVKKYGAEEALEHALALEELERLERDE